MARCDLCNVSRGSRVISGCSLCDDCFKKLDEYRSLLRQQTTSRDEAKEKLDQIKTSMPNAASKAMNLFNDAYTNAIAKIDSHAEAIAQLEQQTRRQNEYEKLQAEEKERIDRYSSEINPVYEYATEYINDSWDGSLKQSLLNETLAKYASKGWRLHTAFVNEAGKNAVLFGSFGLNATMDVTILIFERMIKKASKE